MNEMQGALLLTKKEGAKACAFQEAARLFGTKQLCPLRSSGGQAPPECSGQETQACCTPCQNTLEADLQYLTVIPDEPSGVGIGKSDGPIAAHLRQSEPGAAFVGSPSGFAGGEIRLGLRGDDDRMVAVVAKAKAFVVALPHAADISEAENGSLHGRLCGDFSVREKRTTRGVWTASK